MAFLWIPVSTTMKVRPSVLPPSSKNLPHCEMADFSATEPSSLIMCGEPSKLSSHAPGFSALYASLNSAGQSTMLPTR